MGAAAQRFGLSLSQSPQILNHFTPLLGLRLHKVRNIYDLLFTQALPASPFVKVPAFQRVLSQLSIRQPDLVTTAFTRSTEHRDSVNFLHFVTAITLYSATHWYYKVKFIFAMFDFDESKSITLDEMVIMGAAVFTGSCAMTGVAPPRSTDLNAALDAIFQELQSEQQISLESLFTWVMNEPETIHLLGKNEPHVRTKERDELFEGLHLRKRGAFLSPEPKKQTQKRSPVVKNNRDRAKKPPSEAQLMFMRLLFDELDPKSTGTVLQSKYISALVAKRLCESSITTLLPLVDTPKSLSELIFCLTPYSHLLKAESIREIARQPELSQEKIQEYKRLFDLLDKNCSGGLDAEELRQGLEYHTMGEVEDMISKYDFDQNKELQFFEFVKMLAPVGVKLPGNLEAEYRHSPA